MDANNTSGEILKGSDEKLAEGNWVFTQQGVAAEQGFRNVSRIWYPKTKPVEDALEALERQAENREDIMVKLSDVSPVVNTDENGVRLELRIGDGRSLQMDEWALQQFCQRLGVPITLVNEYTRPKMNPNKREEVKYERDEQDFAIVKAAILNGMRRRDGGDSFLFRIYDKVSCRAVLSDRYSIVDNRWYLQILAKLMPGSRVSHWRGNADTIYGNVLIPDTIRTEKDSDYGGMISVSNCEIGRRVISQTPSIFRSICMNGCIWGQTEGVELRKRHKGIDLADLSDKIKANIDSQIPLLTSGIDLLTLTKGWKAETKMFNIFTQLAYEAGVSTADINGIAEEWVKESNETTAFGVIDAVTRYGQKMENKDWVRMDTYAGTLTVRKNWDNLNAKAKTVTEKEMAKAFGMNA